MTAGTVTERGFGMMITERIRGASMPISTVQVSSDVMPCDGTETALTNVQLTLPASQLQFSMPQPNVLRAALYLGLNVGTFVVGTIGLFSNDVLFALGAFPGAGTKIAANLPSTAGNIRQFLLDVAYLNGNTFAYDPGPIGGAAIAANIIGGSAHTITLRQLRDQLANGNGTGGVPSNSNAALDAALAARGADDAARIVASGLFTTVGDALSALVQGTFVVSSAQVAALYQAASSRAA